MESSKSAKSPKRREKTPGSSSSGYWRSKSAGSSNSNWRGPKAVVSNGDGFWNSKPGPLSPDSSVSSRNTRNLTISPFENQDKKLATVFHRGEVLNVNYERCFGFLAPIDTDAVNAVNAVYFKVSSAEDQLTSTLTGAMLLIPGDIMEYELANDDLKTRVIFARLCECKPRKIHELLRYVTSLVTTAEEHPEIVLRNITKCPTGFKLVLDHRNPSNELLKLTLELCQVLSSSRHAGLYHSRLKQLYALFGGSPFLISENGVRKCAENLSTDGDQNSSDLLKNFLIRMLEYIPSQLPSILPLLMRLGKHRNSSTTLSVLSHEIEQLPPILYGEANTFLEKLLKVVALSFETEDFLRRVLNVVAGGSNEEPGSQLWSQLPLLPTMGEITTSYRNRPTLPVVKQKGPYDSPEEYIDTYLRLLREDCFAGLLQGIQALREGKVENCDLKLWYHVSTLGVHYNYNASPGITFAVTLPKVKGARIFKAPLGGSLVCFFDGGGGFDSPIWGVVSRCEDSDTTSVCFVDIIVQTGAETPLSSASWSFQCMRLMKGEDMVMAESPTYYRAYQPVLEVLQQTNPERIPFLEEFVFVTWPEEPAPKYLKSTSGVTLDWSCIFKPPPRYYGDLEGITGMAASGMTAFGGEIREGVGAVASLLERGYKTTFDESQLKAVELAVNNRLTIIQGPPGTGKTHVGTTLLQLLLSASTFPKESPVFVITFKNHALDQFLEKCLTFCHRIVRVGGRSKNKTLEEYNLQNLMTRDHEFRFDRAENSQKISLIKVEMEVALHEVNSCLLGFNPDMIIAQAPELHLNYFLQRIVHPARIESCAIRLPEGVTLTELIRGPIPSDLDPVLSADLRDFKGRLVEEMRRWIPKLEVIQAAQTYFSLQKPSSSRILQRDVSCAKDKTDEGQEESRREEEERRSAYENLRQELTDMYFEDSESRSEYRKTNQWLGSGNFSLFSRKNDHALRTTVVYRRLDLENIGSHFDWLAHENPYDLFEEHRAILVHKYWQESVDAACGTLAKVKAEYDTLLKDTEEIGERRKLAILQNAKIIGMTTTGAAIHRNVLKHLSPAVILVEEAAEILEPQVLAALNSDLQHLILIGDHHQLRPPVESYDLERWYGFGVSMFERLAEHNKLPYQPLGLQCRMREEFVPMLLPIYPFLKSHTELVSGIKNKAPTCMAKTMHFWSHEYEETSQRSYVNKKEARMVVALVRWIVSESINPQSLKVLAAYNGQVTHIRKLLAGSEKKLEEVEVHSIDSFQVLHSFMGKIGHLSMRNRLCVAASRARCGVYFVGNHTTLTQNSVHWRTLVSYFEGQNAIDSCIPLCCPRHPEQPPYALSNAAAPQFEPSDVCEYPCEKILPCDHLCSSTCHFGAHSRCKEPVEFTFQLCGHVETKLCYEDEQNFSCKTKVMHKFKNCEHSTEKKCWEVKGEKKLRLKCQVVCGKELKCGHMCKLHCSENCASAACDDCLEIEKEKERIQKQILIKAIASKRKELDMEIQRLKEKGDQGIVLKEVLPDGDSAQAFFLAKDRAEKAIQPDCKALLVVDTVEKIENISLQGKFLEAQRELISPLEIPEWLFYGGPADLLDQVVNKGFRAARVKAHLFDVYSSRVAQKHENHSFLLCEVHLGKTWRPHSLESLDKDLSNAKLRDNGYDSVSVVEDHGKGELRPFAHLIFNPEQAIPRFLVTYKLIEFQDLAGANGFDRFGEQEASTAGGMCRISLKPFLYFQGLCPEECHFRMAESQFFRMSKNRAKKVTKVDFLKNTDLEERFNRKREEFKTSNLPADQQFVFHGTDSDAIDKIATQGFKIGGTAGVAIKCGAVYGNGVYTAVNPDISIAYSRKSNMMLLSLAILGEYSTHHNYGETQDVVVIKDVSQLLPRYVVHYS